MPRFYTHLWNSTGASHDEEGAELSDLDAAIRGAITSIRSIMSDEARLGRIDLRGRAEIHDDAGSLLRRIPFSEAFDLHVNEDS